MRQEISAEWDETHDRIKQNAIINKVTVGTADIFEHHAMAKPHDTEHYKTDDVTKKRAPVLIQSMHEIGPCISFYQGNTQLNHKHRHGNAKDAITQGFQPSGCHAEYMPVITQCPKLIFFLGIKKKNTFRPG
jgi:hypothetical protein